MHSKKLITNKHFQHSSEIITKELESIAAQGIDFEYKILGSKYMAKVMLENGKALLVCPFSKTLKLGNHVYQYKNLSKWLKANKIKVKNGKTNK